MPTTACIVQARLGSTRLPAKVLLPLSTGRTVLEEVLFRCKQIPGVDVLVCAIPDTAENDILDAVIDGHMKEHGGWLVRGPEHDVLARYAKAAEAVKADVIMRVTSDCPLIDPEVCGRVLAMVDRYDGRKSVFSSNCEHRTFPVGFDCEVFARRLLDEAHANATTDEDREHVTPYIRRAAAEKHFIYSEGEDRSHLRWTLDTLEDYVRIWNVFQDQMREAA